MALPTEAEREETARLGMWVFLASEVLFFGGLLVAYGVARLHSPQGFAQASAETDVLLGSVNTAVLLSSSFAMALAAEAAELRLAHRVAPLLWITVALGAVFLAIKGIEWHREWQEGLVPGPAFRLAATRGAELFFMWYFTTTGLHALHLAIGMALAAGLALASRRRRAAQADPPRLHTVALYWHFVDVVWIFLYPLIYLVAPRA
jgi:cytochrome c oxidase subunit 3